MVNYASIQDIKNTIVGNTYKHITPTGVEMLCSITRGAPTICANEIEKMKYVEGVWVAP
jgi:hypothetical protein